MFDSVAYAAAVKTRKSSSYRTTVAGRAVVLEHESYDVPGALTDGMLEVWRVLLPLGRQSVGGLGPGSSSEVVGSGWTRDAALADAHVRITRLSQRRAGR